MTRDNLEAAFEVMVDHAEQVSRNSEEVFRRYTPSLCNYWEGTLADYIRIATRKVLEAVLLEPFISDNDAAYCGPITNGTTLGLPGGWQLLSLLHSACLKVVLGYRIDHIVRGDDAVVPTTLIRQEFDQMRRDLQVDMANLRFATTTRHYCTPLPHATTARCSNTL
eukprot:Lankesteria_metandrocarpae@DN5352_c2_g4_i1.p1